MIALLLAFVVLGPQTAQPGFCESLKTIAVAKDFRPNGPLASIRIPGALPAMIDAQRGYIVVLGGWPLDAQGNLDPRNRTSLLRRVEEVTTDVAACFPDWKHATIIESDSRPELVGGSSFVKEGRTIEVQVYDALDEGYKLRLQVVAPGALAAPTKQARDLCPTLNQVIAAHSVSPDFASLKKTPVTLPGAKSAGVVLNIDNEPVYVAVFGEWSIVGERPSDAQAKEIQESLQSLTLDVAECLKPAEWTPVQRPPSRGNVGALEFTRGKTLIRITGNVAGPFVALPGDKPEDLNKRVTVELIVRAKPR